MNETAATILALTWILICIFFGVTLFLRMAAKSQTKKSLDSIEEKLRETNRLLERILDHLRYKE